ncbi:hypothetical protein GCM10018785_40460 [Streptomyces longispororuber]|uniref:Uncharacterized protein n=1 Tax=Streptomyces longispororuber TaxID=68230 RepID=A0A919DPX3_9ACTN|nr:hypothetical protein GCM10018785_40460 [Streptomyces longispororuber]
MEACAGSSGSEAYTEDSGLRPEVEARTEDSRPRPGVEALTDAGPGPGRENPGRIYPARCRGDRTVGQNRR